MLDRQQMLYLFDCKVQQKRSIFPFSKSANPNMKTISEAVTKSSDKKIRRIRQEGL